MSCLLRLFKKKSDQTKGWSVAKRIASFLIILSVKQKFLVSPMTEVDPPNVKSIPPMMPNTMMRIGASVGIYVIHSGVSFTYTVSLSVRESILNDTRHVPFSGTLHFFGPYLNQVQFVFIKTYSLKSLSKANIPAGNPPPPKNTIQRYFIVRKGA